MILVWIWVVNGRDSSKLLDIWKQNGKNWWRKSSKWKLGFFFYVYLFLTEREREGAGEGQREKETQIRSRLQALSYQHRARCGAQTQGPWDHDLSQSWKLNPLSHSDALHLFNKQQKVVINPKTEIWFEAIWQSDQISSYCHWVYAYAVVFVCVFCIYVFKYNLQLLSLIYWLSCCSWDLGNRWISTS